MCGIMCVDCWKCHILYRSLCNVCFFSASYALCDTMLGVLCMYVTYE